MDRAGDSAVDLKEPVVTRTALSLSRGVLKCRHCPRTFKYKSCLRNHESVHSLEDLKGRHSNGRLQKDAYHTCQICGKNYTTSRSVTNHMLAIHSENGFYKCFICGDKFSKYNNLIWHLQKHVGKNLPKCGICLKYFPSFDVVRIHGCANLGGSPLKCQKCSIYFDDEEAFIKSHLCIMIEGQFCCPCCQYSTQKQEEFSVHFGRHTGRGFFRCHICDRSFSAKSPLRAHLKQHNLTESIICKLCGKQFKSDEAIVRHGLQVHGPKKIKCPECPKYFAKSIHLKQHIVTTHTRKRMLTDLSNQCQRSQSNLMECEEVPAQSSIAENNTLDEIQNKTFDNNVESIVSLHDSCKDTNVIEFDVDEWLDLKAFESCYRKGDENVLPQYTGQTSPALFTHNVVMDTIFELSSKDVNTEVSTCYSEQTKQDQIGNINANNKADFSLECGSDSGVISPTSLPPLADSAGQSLGNSAQPSHNTIGKAKHSEKERVCNRRGSNPVRKPVRRDVLPIFCYDAADESSEEEME